ncbi:MAG: elongation factor G [Candidatus Methylomirabilales bacterium]
MKDYEVTRIRNVAIVGHGGEGKTSLAEAILFDAGAVTRLGRVDEGTTTTDFDDDEIRRKVSISVALAFVEWNGYKLNVLDTPGFSAFLPETKNALRVADAALIVVSAVSGMKVQTEKVWGYAEEFGLPCFFFVNRMDRERADFFRVLEELRKNLSPAAVPVQIPIGAEAAFNGVIDLLNLKAIQYPGDGSGRAEVIEVPAELRQQAEERRGALIEAVAESDDALLEGYLEQGELAEPEVRNGLRRAVQGRKLVPVLCGSATRNVGIHPLLNCLTEYAPSPADRPPVSGRSLKDGQRVTREAKKEAPFVARVFKTVADPYTGKISLFRVYSGWLGADLSVYNATKETRERVGQVVLLRGKNQVPTEGVGAGDIGAVVKLKETGTGDTLCDEKERIVLDPIPQPTPMISYAIAPKSKGDEEKLSSALSRLVEEDPSLRVTRDPQTKESIISGMGKVHLEVAVNRLKRKFGVEVQMKTPRVPYRETMRGSASVQGKYKKQTGGRGQYGDCWIELEPLPRGSGFVFENRIVGGVIPRQYIPAVEKGIVEAMEGGVLAGYPVVDVKVTLYDGSYHTVDSSEMAFKIAGSLAFKKAVLEATPVLLEPVMTAEVVAPDDCIGDLIGDLNARRGRVLGVELRGKNQVVKAKVPLAEMLEYAPQLRSITGDRGDYTTEFSHYEEVPAYIQERIVAEAGKAQGKA